MKWRRVAWLAPALCLSGCVVESGGPLTHDYSTIEKDSNDLVRVTMNMGAGNLRVGSGTDKLMRADFDYNVPSWKPEVRYSAGVQRNSLNTSLSSTALRRFSGLTAASISTILEMSKS